jgi:hypothetical protein
MVISCKIGGVCNCHRSCRPETTAASTPLLVSPMLLRPHAKRKRPVHRCLIASCRKERLAHRKDTTNVGAEHEQRSPSTSAEKTFLIIVMRVVGRTSLCLERHKRGCHIIGALNVQ